MIRFGARQSLLSLQKQSMQKIHFRTRFFVRNVPNWFTQSCLVWGRLYVSAGISSTTKCFQEPLDAFRVLIDHENAQSGPSPSRNVSIKNADLEFAVGTKIEFQSPRSPRWFGFSVILLGIVVFELGFEGKHLRVIHRSYLARTLPRTFSRSQILPE